MARHTLSISASLLLVSGIPLVPFDAHAQPYPPCHGVGWYYNETKENACSYNSAAGRSNTTRVYTVWCSINNSQQMPGGTISLYSDCGIEGFALNCPVDWRNQEEQYGGKPPYDYFFFEPTGLDGVAYVEVTTDYNGRQQRIGRCTYGPLVRGNKTTCPSPCPMCKVSSIGIRAPASQRSPERPYTPARKAAPDAASLISSQAGF